MVHVFFLLTLLVLWTVDFSFASNFIYNHLLCASLQLNSHCNKNGLFCHCNSCISAVRPQSILDQILILFYLCSYFTDTFAYCALYTKQHRQPRNAAVFKAIHTSILMSFFFFFKSFVYNVEKASAGQTNRCVFKCTCISVEMASDSLKVNQIPHSRGSSWWSHSHLNDRKTHCGTSLPDEMKAGVRWHWR